MEISVMVKKHINLVGFLALIPFLAASAAINKPDPSKGKQPVPTVVHVRVDPNADVNILNIDVDGTPNDCQITVECQTISGRRVCFITKVSCGIN